MTIIQEIYRWSKGLPAWQQDAIARLYAERGLGDDDLDELLSLAKAEAGIPDPSGRQPRALQDAEVALPTDPARVVQLLRVKDLVHVNALVHGGSVPIAQHGLTVIYGENGAGKSGYSRVFKHACRARDRREPILPNANIDPRAAGKAQAVFEVLINGKAADLPWLYGQASPEPLSDISIFDTHCARAYIDNHGDFAYAPYGLDILEGLVGACNKLKTRAAQEKAANAPSDAAYVALTKENTAVAALLLGIPAKTKAEQVAPLSVLTDEEESRLVLLARTLAETDPKQKAKTLRQKAARFTGLNDRLVAAAAVVSDEKITQLRSLIQKSKDAKAAAEVAATEFRQTPGQLTGTGGEEWKILFEAAREFAETSHAKHVFPALSDASLCPLCQNVLGPAGAQRLVRFDTFIKHAAEKSAKHARDLATTEYRTLQQAPVDVMFVDALFEELNEVDAQLASAVNVMQEALVARKASALKAAAAEVSWENVSALSDDPQSQILKLIDGLQQQAKALDATTDEKVRAGMVAEKLELDARVRLGKVKEAVLEAIDKHEICRKLQLCIDGLDTRGISRKSTELSRTIASQDLADALNEELKRLKVHHLQVIMKPESLGGKTQFKLVLQLPGGGTPATILSEGEQRAIAIASFLAEIKLGKGRGGIVFDDPVSSLDHRRRWEVAERLAEECLTRQVIVFTHDIYFLCILEQKTEELGTTLTKNYIRRTAQGFGVHSQDLPFDVLGTKDRLGRLKQMAVEVRKAQKDGNDDEHRRLTSVCYGKLRLAWERCIEEVLLNGAVQRFGEGVSTQKLKSVVVTDDDYREVDAGMTKSSKFEHDAAMAVGRLPIPDPDELDQDIARLSLWRDAVNKRLGETAKSRG
ncbi:AAA family ATPase [Acidovorax sp. SUPP3434]|uniref:AAA family ATPase n=1 Tax=Acidovorax sp. SUPP3434 TaxID=2920880 RepID=UPI0023DE6A07|nr:AAA family ATPase [Acidovorax sp. SUPP3434]GKT02085.1 AAA family ATPase [Acidovorax sp. SUPP3434]